MNHTKNYDAKYLYIFVSIDGKFDLHKSLSEIYKNI